MMPSRAGQREPTRACADSAARSLRLPPVGARTGAHVGLQLAACRPVRSSQRWVKAGQLGLVRRARHSLGQLAFSRVERAGRVSALFGSLTPGSGGAILVDAGVRLARTASASGAAHLRVLKIARSSSLRTGAVGARDFWVCAVKPEVLVDSRPAEPSPAVSE